MDDSPPHPIAATLVLLGCAGVTATHLASLYTSGLDPVWTPLDALSRGEDGNLTRLGLWLFALAHAALAVLLHRLGARWSTRAAQLLLVVDGALVIYLARLFGTTSATALIGPQVQASLSLLVVGTGFAMALLVPGLMRNERHAGLWNVASLIVWLALVPLCFTADASWLGACERVGGVVLVLWMTGLAMLIGFGASAPTR